MGGWQKLELKIVGEMEGEREGNKIRKKDKLGKMKRRTKRKRKRNNGKKKKNQLQDERFIIFT